MTDYAVRQLACAVTLQAVRDYCSKRATASKRLAILKDLRSDWMDMLTDGTSIIVAEQLEKYPKEIAVRLRKYKDEEQQL